MNKPTGGPQQLRWGKGTLTGPRQINLPRAPRTLGCSFRNEPILGTLLAWIAGEVEQDLRQPESRIKAFVRRILENRKYNQRIKAIVVPPSAIEGPAEQRDGKTRMDGDKDGNLENEPQ